MPRAREKESKPGNRARAARGNNRRPEMESCTARQKLVVLQANCVAKLQFLDLGLGVSWQDLVWGLIVLMERIRS